LKVSVIGQGYVGLPLAMSLAEAGHEVIGLDSDSSKISNLLAGKTYIEDISTPRLNECLKSGKYSPTDSPKAIANSEVVVIAVPTPLNSAREPDLNFVKSASEVIGQHMKRDCLVINESTSFPGTLRNVIKPTVEKFSKYTHEYAISPERVDPGNKTWNMKNTPRLFAGLTKSAGNLTQELYSTFCDKLIEVSSPEVAETAKLFENTFRQVNIALVNELEIISNALGISVYEILDAANSKPYGFMKFKPGLGVGGHCIPVDPTYLAYAANEKNIRAEFIDLANRVNNSMPDVVCERILNILGSNFADKKVLIMGISYKANISDVRESPSIELIKKLRAAGVEVVWNDDLVREWSSESSTSIGANKFDLTILAMRHDYMTDSLIYESSKVVFDCTGTLSGTLSL
jgi:UDP-N-acetyl-D-glucosamine dehydrogenase